MVLMTRDQVKEILDRVLAWPADDQEKVARFVREVEERRDDITDQEWEVIEARGATRSGERKRGRATRLNQTISFQ